MSRNNHSVSTKVVQSLLSVCMVFIGAVYQWSAFAAELTDQDIKKTLVRIQQKYAALAAVKLKEASTRGALSSSPIKPNANRKIVSPINIELTKDYTSIETSEYQGRFPIGEELILDVKIGTIPLGDILAVKSALGVKIGLSEFFQLVDFSINVDIDSVSAKGWYIANKNEFSLSIDTQNALQVSVSNRLFTIPKERFLIDDDIFVELVDIAKWFSIESSLDEATLVVDLTTTTPFPIESQLKRQQKHIVSGGNSESVLPLKNTDHQLFSMPLLDMRLSTRFNHSNRASSYSIQSSQDLAYFTSQAFFSGNDDISLLDARLTLSRRSKQADLLGPLNMSEYAFGDVVPVNTGAGITQSLGRGFTMSNASGKLVDNRRINLAGEIQVSWDVELYRNGILIDKNINVANGRYEFNDVELNFGTNNFEMVFYGPQGQIERRTETHHVDSNAVDSGKGIMQFSVVDNNRSLFGKGGDPSLRGISVASTYEYGLTDWLSLGVGASMFLPKEGDNEQGASFRSNMKLGAFGLLNSVFQFDDDNSFGMRHTFRTKIANVGWNISYNLSGVISDDSSLLQSVTDTLSVGMSGILFSKSILPINYENNWVRNESANSIVVNQFYNSIGMNTKWGSFSHGLSWLHNEDNNESSDNLIIDDLAGGTLGYSNYFGPVFTRVSSSYQIKPLAELTAVAISLSYAFTPNVNTGFRFTYDTVNENERYNLRLSWIGDTFHFSSTANYSNKDSWNVNFGVSFGLGYEQETDTLFSTGRTLGSKGAVVLRMFEDENLDQQYTEGENLLGNVNVSAVQSYRKETTSEDGIAILKSLSSERATDIVVDEDTFLDPYMMVSTAGFAVVTRRGLLQQFDIPVVNGGELDGIIYIRNEEGIEEVAPYLSLSLVNNEGEVIATTRSEYDGYYVFEKVLPDNYQIRVDTSKGRQRGTTLERLKEVKISNRGDLIVDVDMVLRQLKSANGYIANIGDFSSLGLLKVYAELLSKRIDSNWLDGAFFIELKSTNRYLLGIKYIEGQDETTRESIVRFCQDVLSIDVDCQADNVEFGY